MKKPILMLLACLILAACSNEPKIAVSQKNFVERLKRAQDTATLFDKQQAIKQRIITNMGKYIAANMTFSKWKFDVKSVSPQSLELKVPAIEGQSGYDVKYVITLPTDDAALQEGLAKVKSGDNIKIDGQVAMFTPDGKISMNDYFLTDSAKFIKIKPTKLY